MNERPIARDRTHFFNERRAAGEPRRQKWRNEQLPKVNGNPVHGLVRDLHEALCKHPYELLAAVENLDKPVFTESLASRIWGAFSDIKTREYFAELVPPLMYVALEHRYGQTFEARDKTLYDKICKVLGVSDLKRAQSTTALQPSKFTPAQQERLRELVADPAQGLGARVSIELYEGLYQIFRPESE